MRTRSQRKALSKPQRRALAWLRDRGGHALLGQYGKAIAQGETASFVPATWLRLMISGHIARSPMPDHFGITALGLEAIA